MLRKQKKRQKKVFCWFFFLNNLSWLSVKLLCWFWLYLTDSVLLKLFMNKTMAFIKFFMIEWILNFSIYTKATLEVQLSKHSDITGDKMICYLQYPTEPLGECAASRKVQIRWYFHHAWSLQAAAKFLLQHGRWQTAVTCQLRKMMGWH